MRRFLTSTAVFLAAAAWAIPAPTVRAATAEPAGDDDTIVDDSEDEDTIVDDSEMDGDVVVDDSEDEGDGGEVTEGEGEGDAGGDTDAGGLFGEEEEDKAAAAPPDPESEAKQLKADQAFITVVQRQRFLKKKRFDIQPQVGITVNDPFVRHYFAGAELNYWLTNRMAVGLTGSAFFGQKTSRYNNVRAQLGMLLTANKTLWQASANFLYNPFYGKIAVFNRALMHWEAYVQIGGGVNQTQIIPRYEALHEPFSNFNPQGNFAIGSRYYIARSDWISVNFGVRTWIFPDKLEPAGRGPSTGPGGLGDDAALDDPSNAKSAAQGTLAFNVVVFLGVSFYIPTTFEYTTRR